MREGKFRIEFEHRGLESIAGSINKLSLRLSFGMVMAALILGTATLLLPIGIQTTLIGLPTLAVIITGSLVIVFMLFFAIVLKMVIRFIKL